MEQEITKKKFFTPFVQTIVGTVVIIGALVAVLLVKHYSAYVPIEDSKIEAPLIGIGPQTTGVLSEVYVADGETVAVNQPLARVGSEVLFAKTAGLVIDVKNTPGQVFTVASPVVTMIDPSALQVTGTIEETKGLSKIAVGQPVSFTVDAYKGQIFTARISEVSETSDESSIAFSISDKREIKKFEVKAIFDITAHPEFKNGMSAKMKVYTK